ncbi:ornithine carbamoyltransferase [Candidatus Microgenomates bacterium]|nr:MAG: ornithine carbamoyltransferase [Candidatus Microgenomates bacterium]
MKQDFLSITDLSPGEIMQLIQTAHELKHERKEEYFPRARLDGKIMAMIFEKPSLRTKLSFDIGMFELGGHTVTFQGQEIGLDTRESVKDVAKVLSTMAHILVVRTFTHEQIVEFAQNASVPVINALTDLEHPCQVLADLMTIWEIKKTLTGLKICYLGDGKNNMAHSLMLGTTQLGMHFSLATAKKYFPDRKITNQAQKIAQKNQVNLRFFIDPQKAIQGAHVVITDTWISMGDAIKDRLEDLRPYQVNHQLMQLAKNDALFLHCLPAQRGNEVTSEVIGGSQSCIITEAENRLHIQKALLLHLLGK